MSKHTEEAIIFCLLDNPSLIMSCSLDADDFLADSYKLIYSAIVECSKTEGGHDVVQVVRALQDMNRPNAAELAESIFRDGIASPSQFPKYCAQTKADSQKRQAKMIAQELSYNLDHNSDVDAVGMAIQKLMRIGQASDKHSHTMKEAVTAGLEAIQDAYDKDGIVGVPTGMTELDDALGGFHDSDLVIIGARPAMGKTALLVSLSNSDVPAGIISAEQNYAQLGQRYLANQGSVHSQNMRTASLNENEWTRLSAAARVLTGRNQFINDEGSISLSGLVQQAREWKFKHDIKILYVDYLQKIRTRQGANKVEQVTEVTYSLKNLAKELNIPVVALAQVKRDVDSRTDTQPQIGDMSDASEIEKEADVIITLKRDEAYDPDTERKGIADLLICKNRHGPTGLICCQFVGKYFQFKNFGSAA